MVSEAQVLGPANACGQESERPSLGCWLFAFLRGSARCPKWSSAVQRTCLHPGRMTKEKARGARSVRSGPTENGRARAG